MAGWDSFNEIASDEWREVHNPSTGDMNLLKREVKEGNFIRLETDEEFFLRTGKKFEHPAFSTLEDGHHLIENDFGKFLLNVTDGNIFIVIGDNDKGRFACKNTPMEESKRKAEIGMAICRFPSIDIDARIK